MHQHSTMSSSSDRSSFKDTPSSPKISRPLSPASRMSIEQGDELLPANALASPSARSSFLKALGKFKSKHLQQKRSSAPPPAIDTLDAPTTSVLDRRASYVIPPITFDEAEEAKEAEACPTQDAAITFAPAAECTEMTATAGDEPMLSVPSGTSSLRVKFKNKVNSKLASMRSSSNLREKMKEQPDTQRQSQMVDTSKTDSTADNSSNRHSKSAWTIPRIRPESRQGSRPQTPWSAETSASKADSEQPQSTMPSPMDSNAPCATLDQQLKALKVEELDSDHSLDIITPADYEDYTQFAELPLKKRKKMERALAANLSADATGSEKRPISMRASADAVKRFLSSQQRQDSSKGRLQNNKTEDKDVTDSVTVVAREISPTPFNSNKKRPQSPTECADAASSGKKAGHQAADWRRSLMRSLHLGKGNAIARSGSSQPPSNLNKSSAPPLFDAENDQTASHEQSGAEAGRLARSGSVRTVRALSLTTSSHPALLATTVSKTRGQGLRRETLEMAMRRRRQSSVVTARSNISNTDIPPVPTRPAEFFEADNASTTNITHTFTSFTLEFADMHHAHEVMNNSVVPGLFNFKARKPRLTVSSNIMMELDTDQEFRGFDSDGDAISGYTGDADVSMDDIQIHSPKLSSASRSGAEHLKVRTREPSSAADVSSRRKISSVDGDSDTITELPTLMIRTRDLNRSNSGGRGASNSSGNNAKASRPLSGSSIDVEQRDENERENPRSPRRAGAISPNTTPRTGRSVLSINTDTRHVPSSPTKATRARMSMEEIVSWEPRDMYSHSTRPAIPALDTKPLKPTRGTGMTPSTALASSSRMPLSGLMTQSPSVMTPASGIDNRGSSNRHHQQQSSSSSSTQYPSHQHQMSGDTLVPNHYKNFSSGSTMSASSGYSAHTLPGGRPQHYQYPSFSGIETGPPGAQEYNPNDEFSPSTPADLKAMDFEALLATAEREHQKEWEEMKVHKQTGGTSVSMSVSSSSMTQQHPRQQQQQPDVPPLKIANSASKAIRSAQQQQQPPQRSTVAFDLGPSDDGGTGTGTGTGSDRSMRSKRVMKKKMSVIRLTGNGNIQGRREDDGVIRVSISPGPGTSAAVVGGGRDSTQTHLYSQNQWRQ
ncbi:hypothetical protein BGZ68_005978 [Mortierella alpina]|nr:hypothetical protein BGZ68_005978 [Mortierella alpina]